LLQPLRTIPPVEYDHVQKGFRLPLATVKAWCALETDLSFVLDTLNFKGTGYVVLNFPYPSNFGFNRAHATRHLAERQARISRDWFMILMGAVSYVVFARRHPAWFESLKERNISQAWIASLEACTVLDTDFERVGCFVILNDPTRSHPETSLLRRLKVPMWFPWGQRETDIIADKLRRGVVLDSFWYPKQAELDNPTVINHYDNIPPTVSYRPRYNPAAFRRLPSPTPVSNQSTPPPSTPARLLHSPTPATPYSSTARPSSPARVGTPPSPDSGQRPGQTWQEFFKERDERRARRPETDRERTARQARERQPGRNKSNFFEWRRNSAHEWIRHKLPRKEGQRLLEDVIEGECRYDAATDTWDICEDFATTTQQPTAENNFAGFDYDDIDDYEMLMMSGRTAAPSSACISDQAASSHLAGPAAAAATVAAATVAPTIASAAIAPPVATAAPATGHFTGTHALPHISISSSASPPAAPFAAPPQCTVGSTPLGVIQEVRREATCVPPLPAPPPFEEAVDRPPLLVFLRARIGFVPPTVMPDPSFPPSTQTERNVVKTVLQFEATEFDNLSDIVWNSLVELVDILVGPGKDGGVGIRDVQRPASTLSLRGASYQPPKMSHRQKKRAKEYRLSHAAKSSRSGRVSGEVEHGSSSGGVPMSVDEDGPEPGEIENEDLRLQLRPETCDLHANNPHHIHLVGRLLQARKLTFSHGRNKDDDGPCFLLSLPSDTSWSLGFVSSSALLYACRLQLEKAIDIASHLLQIGIPFKTLVRLPPDWKPKEQGSYADLMSLPARMETPYRSKRYTFGPTDYAVYERQRQMLFSQRHLRAACLVGGIVWRLGRDLLREEEVLGGPTDTVTVFGEGVFYRDGSGDLWCDDALTTYEMDLICGIHSVATGTSYSLLVGTPTDLYFGYFQDTKTRLRSSLIGRFKEHGTPAPLA
jgi:hypothetical protein